MKNIYLITYILVVLVVVESVVFAQENATNLSENSSNETDLSLNSSLSSNSTDSVFATSTSSVIPASISSVESHNSPSINESVSDYNDFGEGDSGKVAGIVIGIIGGLALAGALVAFCVYKQYIRHNVKSMNFDNPVYRKTTEDQFSLEKNQYQTTRTYPAVSEETLEPLTNPGTNEFV